MKQNGHSKATSPAIFEGAIEGLTRELCALLQNLPLAEQVEALNGVRRKLHETSPFRDEPVDLVEWVPAESVQANSYNPNTVAPPEMRLLRRSIRQDGFTQPIVTFLEGIIRTVVDGFHRNRVGKEDPVVRDRVRGYLPVTSVRSERGGKKERMAATIRHNRARGVHGVLPMVEVVAELLRNGWNDSEIAEELGMDPDEVLRFKQTKGLPELFRNAEYSRAWETNLEPTPRRDPE